MAKVAAIVLAAGLSRRMGSQNKLFLPIRGKDMIAWTMDAVLSSEANHIMLVASKLSMPKLAGWASERVHLVENQAHETGMTSSIQAGVGATSADGYIICLGDQPTVRATTYNQLIQTFKANPDSIILPYHDGQKGNPVIFPQRHRSAILHHQEPEGCKSIVQDNMDHVIKVQVEDPGVLIDIDTDADYDQLR